MTIWPLTMRTSNAGVLRGSVYVVLMNLMKNGNFTI